MTQILTAYVVTALVFLTVDFIWLSMMGKTFYYDRVGHLLADQPNMAAAAGFYVVYVVGIVIFAVHPALKADSSMTALAYGAMFGFFAYATYDMTNFATLKSWPLMVAVVDIAWGSLVTGTAAFIGYLGARYLLAA